MTPNFRGPYHVGRLGAEQLINGEVVLDPKAGPIMRHADGSMIIMGTDADGEAAPVLLVPMRVRPKRGEAWRTADPDQETFAAALVVLLNAAAVEPFANGIEPDRRLNRARETLETVAEWLNATPQGYHGALGDLNRRKINETLAAIELP
jgi:hypothetical protein